ncbi:hypothetical protein A8C32_13405 [Flavivirga aquatica]|uniref:Histidine kinase domain-containing protein n=1 Tax=Flavivirga aquatica TaxID=1849968 RepID=A0A1E5TE84_9FLAO|nr:ATP-binding protein [Flavivirga aquatica]OEK09692.1 hypothetical protein A8C32_13405 [Flavivirga aquatica]
MYHTPFYIILLFLVSVLNAQNGVFKNQLERIQELRKLSNNQDLDLEARIDYAKQASELSYKTEVDSVILNSNIALAWVYTYDELLEDDELLEKDSNSYATILNNIAYTKFLSKSKEYNKIDSLFTKAYKIFDELNLFYELSSLGNDMAEFYYEINKKEKALYYSKRSYKVGKEARKYDEILRALKMLSKLKEGDSGKAYLYEYITLNDSLISNERANRNKYARIQFETDQYIEKTKELTVQNILTSIIGGILILVLGLLYFIKLQRSKNSELVFESEQQKTNEEIFMLMLEQKTKLEEVRLQERHRIAEDLHDGILSQLFGTRIGMGFLELKGDEDTLKDYNRFLKEMQKIEKEIRDVSHELKNDVVLLETNFEIILDQYLIHQSRLGFFEYKITNNDVLFKTINDTVKVNIYRIIQEAVQNIIKHAKAKQVSISFSLASDVLYLKIEDDGIGFDVNLIKKGIGLKNIESRVLKVDGVFKIIATPYKSTILNISIPL